MKIIYNIIGFLALFLGFIGIFLPLLPTTPFLILSLYLFSKSSDKYYKWLLSKKIFKKYLSKFIQNKELCLKSETN